MKKYADEKCYMHRCIRDAFRWKNLLMILSTRKRRKKKMQIAKNKTIATLIALFLMLTITATLVALPIANAHDPAWTYPTTAYCVAVPSRIGIGQYTTIVVWTDRYPGTAGGGSGQRWNGFKIDITKPDGTKETIGPFKSGSDVACDYRQYTPDQLGTYTIVFSWPGETVVATPGLPSTSAAIGDYYQGSTSEPATLVVQQDPIAEWQEPPLPTGYWTRPINAANRAWSQLASNWLKGGWLVDNWQRWGTAPESAHVLWTQPITPALAGGINDAAWPSIPSDVNDYEAPWSAPIIMNGKIYYNQPAVSDVAKYGYYCRDLYTGEIIWYKNGTDNGLNNPYTTAGGYTLSQSYLGLTQGQLYHYYGVNGQGILAYLIMVSGTTWYFLDASTGNFMLKLINVPSGTAATDQDGSLLLYSYNAATGNLLCWNSSQSIPPLAPLGTNQQQWKMRFGATIDAVNDTTWTVVGPTGDVPATAIRPRSGYTMNVTIPKGLPGSIAVLKDAKRVPKQIFGSTVSGDTVSAWLLSIDEHVAPYSPYPEFSATQNNNLGFGATLLWNKNITVPLPGKNYTWGITGISYDSQVFFVRCPQTRQKWCYSLTTGTLLWGPTIQKTPMGYYATGGGSGLESSQGYVYYGIYLAMDPSNYDGQIYAYNATTGTLLWIYNATSVGRESPYGDNMPLMLGAVCDGKVYVYSSEHSPSKPLWRASYLRCINITDGTELWKLLNYHDGTGGTFGIADGYIVSSSQYDNLIYCIGKGPSAVTVDAPMTAITAGSSVVIRGTVTDQSPGAKGTPAIADADMQAWMEYLYEQQAMPTNAKGVEVTLDTIDPNGNFVHIGTVTSDTSGGFKKTFTPEVPGEYTVIATFAGSKSYGSSYAQTYLSVSEAPPAPAAPEPQAAAPDNTLTIIGTGIAVIIAVAIATILLLRKRP